jgi:nucleoside triphosphate pyrophosphatase
LGPLVLASRSPQRRAILELLGVPFTVRVPDVAELTTGPPQEVAAHNARAKASSAAARDETVLGVDTLVTLGGRIFGKPSDEDTARETLRRLAGATHEVVSAVALLRGGELRCAVDRTAVTFRDLDEATIDWYLTSGEWRERAGAYAIQGRGGALVRRIDGDYLNVVGLPVGALLDLWPELLRDSQDS